MAENQYATALDTIRNFQSTTPLSILHLAEPLVSSNTNSKSQHNESNIRTSDGSSIPSNTENDNPTPESLNADLMHYKDLFSKLRFSYLEQVTKEKYLRSIVGDPPLLVSQADNQELEKKLVGMKSDLKAKKTEVDELVKEMEILAVKLAMKYEKVKHDTQLLEEMPPTVEKLQMQVEQLEAEVNEKQGVMEMSNDPRMNMGLEQTNLVLEEQRKKNLELSQRIEILQRQIPLKTRECEKVNRELEDLGRRRNDTTKLARELQRIREEGGRDPLEEQGKWYRSSEVVLRGLLNIEA